MKTVKPFRLLPIAWAAACVAAAAPATATDAYPSRPIRLAVGFAPGTGPDILARTLGQKLGELMGQPVVVENRAGAGGQIAAQFVAKAPPDGYTVLIADVSAISIAPAAFSKLGYDPVRELAPVSEVVKTDFILVVPNTSAARSVEDFVKFGQSRDKVNFGTFGAGTPGHFGAEMFAELGRFRIEPIHYRATGDAVSAVVSGDVNGVFMSTALATAQVKGGKMRALATTAPRRSPLLPEVPTFIEAGYPKADFSAWFALFVPAGTPEPVIATLNAKAVAAVQSPEARQRLEEAGFSISGTSAQETRRMIEAETERWKKIVAATGFKGD
ncbi:MULTISPECIES: tripartite tricarboxylate transporter substrate binding protein [Pigmentiphaga]|uniref:Tripartite tricarboxylate transporter substrate binding protein n=1 Tax=Pigmentiphaga daeguensis TaxID=414049 RepID=A0ABP3L182_9BURK|nr:tripartite tricarboxylate transporter substrate binding protein [Pigmentiphaga sp. D-2]